MDAFTTVEDLKKWLIEERHVKPKHDDAAAAPLFTADYDSPKTLIDVNTSNLLDCGLSPPLANALRNKLSTKRNVNEKESKNKPKKDKWGAPNTGAIVGYEFSSIFHAKRQTPQYNYAGVHTVPRRPRQSLIGVR